MTVFPLPPTTARLNADSLYQTIKDLNGKDVGVWSLGAMRTA